MAEGTGIIEFPERRNQKSNPVEILYPYKGILATGKELTRALRTLGDNTSFRVMPIEYDSGTPTFGINDKSFREKITSLARRAREFRKAEITVGMQFREIDKQQRKTVIINVERFDSLYLLSLGDTQSNDVFEKELAKLVGIERPLEEIAVRIHLPVDKATNTVSIDLGNAAGILDRLGLVIQSPNTAVIFTDEDPEIKNSPAITSEDLQKEFISHKVVCLQLQADRRFYVQARLDGVGKSTIKFIDSKGGYIEKNIPPVVEGNIVTYQLNMIQEVTGSPKFLENRLFNNNLPPVLDTVNGITYINPEAILSFSFFYHPGNLTHPVGIGKIIQGSKAIAKATDLATNLAKAFKSFS